MTPHFFCNAVIGTVGAILSAALTLYFGLRGTKSMLWSVPIGLVVSSLCAMSFLPAGVAILNYLPRDTGLPIGLLATVVMALASVADYPLLGYGSGDAQQAHKIACARFTVGVAAVLSHLWLTWCLPLPQGTGQERLFGLCIANLALMMGLSYGIRSLLPSPPPDRAEATATTFHRSLNHRMIWMFVLCGLIALTADLLPRFGVKDAEGLGAFWTFGLVLALRRLFRLRDLNPA